MNLVRDKILSFNFLDICESPRGATRLKNCKYPPCGIECSECSFHYESKSNLNWVCGTWARNSINKEKFENVIRYIRDTLI